ncbi:hypothetical protein [Roseovarius aestuariivivens]|uniref:hypothetical protein n=1 Tax=Roseovarius aestuariivivens TaxID=1888910 RepID=UPI0010803EB5|nr:hypothetical protein [Roseovarius aestuariivivens]
MYSTPQGSIAALGYRDLDEARFPGIVRDIDAALQMTDAQPRNITWDSDYIAMIDREETRIALGFLPAMPKTGCSYLVLAVGTLDDAEDMLGAVPTIHLADRLLLRIKDDLPYDTIMRGETPQEVDSELIWSLFEMLVQTPAPAGAANSKPRPNRARAAPDDSYEDFEIIDSHEVSKTEGWLAARLARRAKPTRPLRLAVHVTGLTVMLTSAPLGAFMFTYSMLRDVAGSDT